jgi:predicted O-methyltransferase YrrM
LRQGSNPEDPCWINGWLEGLDTLALYGFVASRKPAQYLEIGSGYSTKLVRRAIRDHSLPTQLTSIDPNPRSEIDALCDEIIRQPLESTDLTSFDKLEAGDILFFDGSHRAFMNSDVTVFFLEVLPRLRPGVLVHIHDIELPYDYMPERAHWYYSEQYMLGASLLAGHRDYRVVLPNAYVSRERDLVELVNPLWQQLPGVTFRGSSFWMETQ